MNLAKMIGMEKKLLDVSVEGLPSYNDAVDELEKWTVDRDAFAIEIHRFFRDPNKQSVDELYWPQCYELADAIIKAFPTILRKEKV